MTKWDVEYLKLCKEILKEGNEVKNRTGINTLKIPSYNFHFDLGEEFPILQTKQLFFRNAITEILWIYQAASNDVNWLHERNNHIWDEWMVDEDGIYRTYKTLEDGTKVLNTTKDFGKEFAGTIGTAYGWIVKRYNLINNLITTIKTNPTDRRMIMSLWQNEWLNTAVLPSCVYCSEWDVTNGKLNALVHQRSCDVPLGLPFNVTQYATLLKLLAQCTDLEPGTLDWSIKDAHIYTNQISGIETQIKRQKDFEKYSKLSKEELIRLKASIEDKLFSKTEIGFETETALSIIELILNPEKPYLWTNPDIKDFNKFDNSKELKDIKVKQYKHMGKINFPIAQ